MTPSDLTRLDAQLHGLHLHYIQSHYQALGHKGRRATSCSHRIIWSSWLRAKPRLRENRSIERRIKNARFPVLKSSMTSSGTGPKRSICPLIQNLFRLAFIATQTNVAPDRQRRPRRRPILSISSPASTACLNGHSVAAVHHCRGHHQHPGSGPVRRPSQARVPSLSEAQPY